MSKKLKPTYSHIEKHVFRPSVPTGYNEQITVYMPLMACEVDMPYTNHYKVSDFQDEEFKSVRRDCSKMFADTCSRLFTKDMTPRAMMRAMVCSAEIRATEVSLWGAYTVAHLFIDGQAKQLEQTNLNYCLDNLPVSPDTLLEKEKTESGQNFRLIQIKLNWVQDGKKKSAISRIKPIEIGGWFTEQDESEIEKATKIESVMPKKMPQIKKTITDNVSLDAEERIEFNLREWNDILLQRYKAARSLCIANRLMVEDTFKLFLRDKTVRKLDKLISLERKLTKAPTAQNMLPDDHAQIATDLLLLSRNHTTINAYETTPYEIQNIHMVPICYDLADNIAF